MRTRVITAISMLFLLAGVATAIAWTQLPGIGAGALLYPARRVSMRATPQRCEDRAFDGVKARLAGWVCRAAPPSMQPAIVYLHGIGDNRDSSIGVIDRFVRRGFDVIAYDSRGHGRSEGDRCTYGFYEKQDLTLVLDQTGVERAIVIGHSLGGAVALQAAAIDPRIVAVVAASAFSDLRTIATERAPFMFTAASIDAAFARAERDGEFVVDEASPVAAAATIAIPVFIIHGALDRGTPPTHSMRVYEALRGPKRLMIVPDAGHNDLLLADAWIEIERWIDATVPG